MSGVPSQITDMSTTAASNSPQGGDAIGTLLDDYLRAIQGIMRTESENKGWERWGDTPTRTSNTTFTITGDVTARYVANRRIKCIDSSTLYGIIVSSAFATGVTTVTVTLDSGNLSASLTEVQLGLDIKSIIALGTIAKENLGAVIVDDGSGNATIGAAQVTGAMIASSVALAGNPTTTTQGQTDNSTKIATTAFANGNARGAQAFTSSGTFTTPASTVAATQFKFTVTGAGAGGAGATAGQGGGAGSTAIYFVSALSASQNITVTVGTHGNGGTSGNNGNDGGTSSIVVGATTVTAPGGIHGVTGANNSGNGDGGGACTNATVSIPGGSAPSYGNQQGLAAGGGAGGASYWGGGGKANGANTNSAQAGQAPGSGGAGGYSAASGANGADGIVLVEWW